MGVMPCRKVGCESIMCDRYSTRHGYICGDCLDVMKKMGISTHKEIDEFMKTHIRESDIEVDLDDEFRGR